MTLERLPWSADAEEGLSRALGEYPDAIREGVESGRMQLWRVCGHSLAVIEVRAKVLICWCYEGRDVVPFARSLIRVAAANGLGAVECTTPHRALMRMGRALGFRLITIDDGRLYRLQVNTDGI